MEKLPSKSVIVPLDVPLTTTLAPIIGYPIRIVTVSEPDGVTIFSEVVRTNKSDEHLLVC